MSYNKVQATPKNTIHTNTIHTIDTTSYSMMHHIQYTQYNAYKTQYNKKCITKPNTIHRIQYAKYNAIENG